MGRGVDLSNLCLPELRQPAFTTPGRFNPPELTRRQVHLQKWRRTAAQNIQLSAAMSFATSMHFKSSEAKIVDIGNFPLERGEVILGLRMSYVTSGIRTADKSNAILSLHGLGGDRVLQSHWAGPGKALDTDRYYVIQPGTLGVASLEANPTTSPTRYGLHMRFPRFTIRDMVNVEHSLVTQHFGIKHLFAIAGTSMGACKPCSGQSAFQTSFTRSSS